MNDDAVYLNTAQHPFGFDDFFYTLVLEMMIDACRLAACRESLPENGDRYGYLQVEINNFRVGDMISYMISYEAADIARKAPTMLNF